MMVGKGILFLRNFPRKLLDPRPPTRNNTYVLFRSSWRRESYFNWHPSVILNTFQLVLDQVAYSIEQRHKNFLHYIFSISLVIRENGLLGQRYLSISKSNIGDIGGSWKRYIEYVFTIFGKEVKIELQVAFETSSSML